MCESRTDGARWADGAPPPPTGSDMLAAAVRRWLGDAGAKAGPTDEHGGTPAEAIERAWPHARALGITRLADITGLDTIGIPVATAYRPNARSLSVSQGKGTSRDAARASALMEAVETAHAEHPRLALRLARLDELRSRSNGRSGVDHFVDPAHLPHRPGALLAGDQPVLWATGISLLDGRDVLVPYDAVHLDHTLAGAAGGYLHVTSNGLASGGTRAEAVVHALGELIERDAARLWELADPERQLATRLDPATVHDAECRALLDRYDDAGIDVALFDLASDLGVPVVLAQITDRTPNPFRPLAAAAGLGCHLHPAVALRRALTEATQTRLIDIAGARDDLDPARYRHAADAASIPLTPPMRRSSLAPIATARPFPDGAGRATGTQVGDAARLVDAVARAGLEPVAIDLTDGTIGIPVVRVVVAGLEGLPAMMTGQHDVLGPRGRRAAARHEDGAGQRGDHVVRTSVVAQ